MMTYIKHHIRKARKMGKAEKLKRALLVAGFKVEGSM